MKLSVFMLNITMIFLLTGCGQATFHGSRVANEDEFLLEYTMFNTTYEHNIDMQKEQVFEVVVDSIKGEISLQIGKEGEKPVYTGNELSSCSFQVKVKDSGTYRISVSGEGAAGSVQVKKEK